VFRVWCKGFFFFALSVPLLCAVCIYVSDRPIVRSTHYEHIGVLYAVLTPLSRCSRFPVPINMLTKFVKLSGIEKAAISLSNVFAFWDVAPCSLHIYISLPISERDVLLPTSRYRLHLSLFFMVTDERTHRSHKQLLSVSLHRYVMSRR
jgi:hypothetical protein